MYLVVTIVLLRARTRARYRGLLFVLCVLLAVTIPGCKHIANKIHFPHSI